MVRYIDADRFKSNLEKAMEKMHVINGIHAVGLEAVIESLNRQPIADVAPKTEVALKVIKEAEQILTAKIINIEEDFFHGTSSHWDATKRDCYEEILVELAELKKKYTEK